MKKIFYSSQCLVLKSIKTFLFLLFLCTSITTLYAQWVERSNGIHGANVRAFVSDGLNLYAGTTNGVYRSSDNGITWTTANAGIENTHVYALVIFGGNLYAGVDEDASTPFGGGVYLSTDSGLTWTAMNTGLTNLRVISLAVSGSNLFAATLGGGVFLSANAGASWSSVNTGITNLNTRKLLTVGTNLFAGAYGFSGVSLFRSSDNGFSWTNIAPSGNSVSSLIENAGNLFVGHDGSGIFRSTDNGASWTPVNTGLTSLSVSALEKIGSDIFAATANGMFMSTDNGTNWTAINNGITNNVILSLATVGGNLYAGTFGSIFLSTNNGANWTSVNTGLTNTLPNQLEVSGGSIFALSNGGIHRSTDNGTTWTVLNTGLTNTNVYTLKSIGVNLFAGTDGGVFLSTDNGLNWSAVNTGLTDTRIRTLLISGANLFAGTSGGGVFLSTNNGTNWTTANNGLVSFNSRSIFELASSGATLYVATFEGCYKSTDNGANWVAASTGLTNTQIQSLTVSGTNLFAGTQGGMFLSTNDGTNWTAINNGLTSFSNRWIWKLTAIGSNVFAGTNDGIFLSTDNGANWSNVGIGLPDTNVRSLTIQDENLFAGIAGRNVWSRPLSEFGISPPPTITSFTPTSGSIGTTVTITGTNFTGATAVSFGGTAATSFIVVSATSITAVVGSGASGNVSVTTPDGTATLAGFTFVVPVPVPAITSFTPASGPIGTTVSIIGTNFSTTPANNIVYFGATHATVTAATSTQLTVTVPVGATYEPITVTVGGLTGYSTHRFLVTHNNGSISFNDKICFAVGSNPREVAMADLNNDGHLDLIVTRTDVAIATIFFGNGNGTFQPAVSITTGSGGAITVGDFSGDGVLDLAFANYSGTTNATASVLINDGAGGFPVTDTYFLSNAPVGVGSGAVYIADADFNLDGYVDLVAAIDNIPGSLSMLQNNGTSFNAKVEYPTNAIYPYSVTTVDLNNDRYPDWVVAKYFSNIVKVFINNGAGGILSEATYATGSGTHEVELGDLDKDGHLDLIAINATGNTLSVLLNDGTGIFDAKTDYAAGSGYQADLELADIDGDGNLDAIAGASGTQIFIMKGDGMGGFGAPQAFNVDTNAFGISVGDLDEDGEPDIVTANFADGSLCILLSKPPPPPVLNIYNALSPDGDGKNDSFFIQYIDLIPETQNNSVRIFNRWGDEVWSGKNYDNTTVKFEGLNNNGKELPGGIYFYKIELGNGEIKTGFISLKR